MKTFLLSVFSILMLGNLQAQKEKIKGNKIVVKEQRNLDSFQTIQLYDNFEITLHESNDNVADIEADSNLQEHIELEVLNGVLKVKSTKQIKRPKALQIKISYNSELKKILAYDRVYLKSMSAIASPELRIESNDDTEVFLTINSDKLSSISNGKASVELHTNAKEVFYQVNESSEQKGILAADSLKIDIYQKGYVKLEGKTTTMQLRMDNNTDFYGQKLASTKASVVAEDSSNCYINTSENITIDAMGESEIYLFGEPKINMNTFANEASLYKKKIDYNPNRLLLN